MPPIANQGTVACSAAWRISSSPVAGRPAFVGVSQTGPTLIWSGRAAPSAAHGGVDLLRRVCREPDQRVRSGRRACLGHGHVVLPDVDAVGAAVLDEVGAVVEDEQRVMRVRRGAERLRHRDQFLRAAGCLLAQLDDPGAAAERRVEQRFQAARRWQPVAHEIQPRGAQAFVRSSIGHRAQASEAAVAGTMWE